MNKKVSIIIVAISLVAAAGGITAGVKANNEKRVAQKEIDALREKLNAKVEAPAPVKETPSAPIATLKEAPTVETNDVAVLMEELAAKNAELDRLRAELEARQNNQRPPRQSWQERMAQMKEENPEQYAEMVQRRTEFQQRMRNDQFQRLTTLGELDTSNMTPEELANHTALVEKLSAMWEQTGQFDPENPPNREAMREIFGNMREVGQMMDQERTYMFKQLGTDVGLTGGEADDFAGYVQSIIDATSMRPPRGGDRGPRGGGGNTDGGGN